MKIQGMFIATLFLVACGGGGGGGESEEERIEKCEEYCSFACAASAFCFANSDLVFAAICYSDCREAVIANGRSGQSCVETQADVSNMTCNQLAVALGLKSSSVLDEYLWGEELGYR